MNVPTGNHRAGRSVSTGHNPGRRHADRMFLEIRRLEKGAPEEVNFKVNTLLVVKASHIIIFPSCEELTICRLSSDQSEHRTFP